MATAESPGAQGLPGDGEERAPGRRTEIPTVAAVVVTRNPGPWLEPGLQSLGSQDYPSLAVLVVDAASEEDTAARITGALPAAHVWRVPKAGFASAANEALAMVRNANFLLICHDDVVLDPGAVRRLLEEAFRSNAGIVGPKIVDADQPEELLEVGRSIDRFGNPHTGIEPGELDQEQHDAVRDVFYVSDAAMLVRADLFHELGGFDASRFPGAEDLDLCWRARLVGARVLVAPAARVRHHQAAEARDGAAPDGRAAARNRIRTVLTLSSGTALLWVVPVGVAASLVEAVLLTVTLRRGRTHSALGAWWSNLHRFREIRRERSAARRDRRIDDGDLDELRARSTRLRVVVTEQVATDDRLRSLGDAGRSVVSAATTGARQPLFALLVGLALLWLLGSRHLLTGGVPAVGTFARWTGVVDMLSTYASGWRYTGLGSSTAAPPGLVAMSGLSTIVFGAGGLARTLVVVLAFPVGAVGAYRLTRRISPSAVAAAVAGFVYAINPVPRNAIASGRLGPLVLFALGPFLVSIAVAYADRTRGASQRRWRAVAGLIGLGALVAFTTAWFVLTPVFLLAAAAAILLAAPLVGGFRLGVSVLVASLVGIVLAAVILLPWSVAMLGAGDDPAASGFAFRPHLDLADVLRFHTGPAGSGWASWGLLAAASFPLLLGRGERFAWATRAWMMALVGWALVWIPARFAPSSSVPAPEAASSLAALGVAVAAGLGVSVFVEDVRHPESGVRRAVAVVAAAGLAFGVLGFAGDAGDGRWGAPDGDWPDTLASLGTDEAAGGFRVLWVGDPALLPLDPFVAGDGTGYTLTRDGSGDARELWRAPARRADRLVRDAVELARAGRTDRLGHLVAPMSVRYVAMPTRPGPGSPQQVPPSRLPDALAGQLDLARLESPPGLALYENTAWIPSPGTVRPARVDGVPLGSVNATGAALRADVGRVSTVRGSPSRSAPTGPGLVLWSEAFDRDWNATARGSTLRHVEPFGWQNGFTTTRRASVSITYAGQLRRYGMIALQVALVLALVVVAWRSRVARPPRPPRVERPNL